MPESSVASRPGVAVTRAPAATAAPRRRLLRAVLTRDGRLLLREWTLMGDVVTAAILWTLLPLVGAPLLSVPSALLARAMLLTLTVGLGYEIAARAVPFERGAWAWMKLAPVSVRQWMLAKFTGAALLSLPLVLIATASMIASFHLAPRAVLEALCVVFPALVLSLSVGLWTGTVFANPNWTNPRSMLTAPGRIVATLLLLVQAGAWLLLVGLEHLGLWLPPHFALWGPATLAGLTAALPIRAAARHLRAREWQG